MNTNNMMLLDREKFIFGSLFLLANKLQVIGDQFLGDDMTTKQWFLTVMIMQFQDRSPTLGEVAALMGSSHQNVRQLAQKLQEKEFLNIYKDEQDGRIIRLQLTEKSHTYWKTREAKGDDFINRLFKDITEDEINHVGNCFNKLFQSIESWRG